MENRICLVCGAEENENLTFHTHHIKPKNKGGSNNKKNLIDICNDCHFDIHHPDHIDGDLDDLEDGFKEALSLNIFSDGYGILPNKIGHDAKISSFAKLLYCDISSLCASKGYCWATNRYFAKIFNVSLRTVSRAIVELEPFLIIRNRQSSKRMIWVHNLGSGEKPSVKKDTELKTKLIKKAKPKVVKKAKYTEDDMYLAQLLLQKIIYNIPLYENKKVNLSEWAEEFRKLREIDCASKDQIEFMIYWIHGGTYKNSNLKPNDFWYKNILSAKKLRKQWFDNLVPQLQEKFNKKKSTPTQL